MVVPGLWILFRASLATMVIRLAPTVRGMDAFQVAVPVALPLPDVAALVQPTELSPTPPTLSAAVPARASGVTLVVNVGPAGDVMTEVGGVLSEITVITSVPKVTPSPARTVIVFDPAASGMPLAVQVNGTLAPTGSTGVVLETAFHDAPPFDDHSTTVTDVSESIPVPARLTDAAVVLCDGSDVGVVMATVGAFRLRVTTI